MTTTRAERMVTTIAAPPRGRSLTPVATDPAAVIAARCPTAPAAAAGGGWALARDAAGGLVVLGSFVALWAWFLAATL